MNSVKSLLFQEETKALSFNSRVLVNRIQFSLRIALVSMKQLNVFLTGMYR